MKPNKKAQDMTVAELAAYIDQSVLKPEFTQAEIRRYIQEGIDFGCKTDKILAKISLSSANIDGADANLKKELPHWSFDKVKAYCTNLIDESKIRIVDLEQVDPLQDTVLTLDFKQMNLVNV